MKTVAFQTLGCKVNQYETEAMAQRFEKSGYKVVDFDEKADVYVVNTCTVTGISARKSRQMARKAKRMNPDAVVAVVGCYSQTQPEEAGSIEGVDIVMGTQDRDKLPEYVEQFRTSRGVPGEILTCVYGIPAKEKYEEMGIDSYRERSRAYIKIQDGCSQFCSYCIIPYARGPVRSRQPEKISEEAEKLAAKGFKEIVITGINIASYGSELGSPGLIDIIKRIHAVEGIERIRLSSLEPMLLDAGFLAQLASLPKLCPHFHISLQSGCDETLKRMNRKYGCAGYEEIVRKLTGMFNDVAITTDVIVGFPGESREEFLITKRFLKRLPLAGIHVFKFSARKGTAAALLKDQVPSGVKEERSKELIRLAEEKKREFYKRFEGKKMSVLFESELGGMPGHIEGMTANYIRVAVPGDSSLIGRIMEAEMLKAEDGLMVGKLI